MEIYDVIIIGGGPAGMSAAVYAARREMKTLIITKELGGQLVWASEIENYPGFKSIQSFDLIMKMQDQVSSLGVETKLEGVENIEKQDDVFKIFTKKEEYKAKTVILALGLSPRKLNVEGETKFNGKGVSYCANCDGPLYKDKEVAVVGGGNSALDAAEVLSKIAKKVYLVHRREDFRGFEALINEVKEKENIELVLNSEIKKIEGEEKMNKAIVWNNKEEEERELEVDGLFVEIGRIANTQLADKFAEKNENNEIIVNNTCETKTSGFFAAGDATQVEFKQIPIAVGQGTIAALAAYRHLQLKSKK